MTKELLLRADSEEGSEISEAEMSLPPPKQKFPSYFGPAFILFWVVLFYAVVYPIFFYLPDGLRLVNEPNHPGQFIAERAEVILAKLDAIGPKVVGSHANENVTVQMMMDEIEAVRKVMHNDLFELEMDVQKVSGAYMHWNMVNMYQSIQNVVVKFRSKNSISENYLLINSHFDSKPGSPGSGDAGAMIVIMLEILRVLATTRETFMHPIIFLFNGGEENPLQASHGFITQHKWAKNCKALMNLDSAGSGGREILFQSGPNHPWLMKHYSKSVKRPFATTVAEELFQANIIPSDTDFRIFRDFGAVPGLDMAHSLNGYVYHTKYDNNRVIPSGSLQNTGDHILALSRSFANATELENTAKYANGHTVFYDFLGFFFIHYTESFSVYLNIGVVVAVLLAVGISMYRMASISYLSLGNVCSNFGVAFVLHLIGFLLGFAAPILVAIIFDSANRSMTWFTNRWLVIGLYIFSSLFGLCVPTLLYLSFNNDDKLAKPFKLQLVLHAHSFILALLCVALTSLGIRTSYLLMIALIFYLLSLIINLLTTLHNRGYYWSIFLTLSQVIPFIYFSYLVHALLCTLMPMMGRFGTKTNPDLYISGLCALGTVLAMGFLIPLLSVFRRSKLLLTSLAVVTLSFCILAITPLGFPYRPETNVQRLNFLEVHRVFYDFKGEVELNESGYYFDFQDRLVEHPLESLLDLSELRNVTEDCKRWMMCGLPVFNHRWSSARLQAKFLPSDQPLVLQDQKATLQVLNRTVYPEAKTVRYEFEMSGPPHMSLFFQPRGGAMITDWSFKRNMLEEANRQPPYHIFFIYGKDSTPLKSFVDIKQPNGKLDDVLMEVGFSAHYVSYEHERSPAALQFIESLPPYSFAMEWPSTYERRLL